MKDQFGATDADLGRRIPASDHGFLHGLRGVLLKSNAVRRGPATDCCPYLDDRGDGKVGFPSTRARASSSPDRRTSA